MHRSIQMKRHMKPLSGAGANRPAFRRACAMLLAVLMLAPAPALSATLGDDLSGALSSASMTGLFSALTSALAGLRGAVPHLGDSVSPKTYTPARPATKAALAEKVSDLQLNVARQVQLYSTQKKLFSAVPLDAMGGSVQGLAADWESSNPAVVSVTADGQAVAGEAGTAVLTARAGRRRAVVAVNVAPIDLGASNRHKVELEREMLGKQRRGARGESGQAVFQKTSWAKGGFAAGSAVAAAATTVAQEEPTPDPYADPRNDVGLPPNRTEPGAPEPPAAVQGTETPGSANFFFNVPLLGLAGRGDSNIKLNLTYNSRVWTEIFSPDTGMVDHLEFSPAGGGFTGTPAPGFILGFGSVRQEGYSMVVYEPDGSRRVLGRRSLIGAYVEERNYFSSDGEQVHYEVRQNDFVRQPNGSYVFVYDGVLSYADGTRMYYDAYLNPPYKIEDRNGNYILITYRDGWSPLTIKDSLGRYVRFHYGQPTATGAQQLIAITGPGYDGGPDRQVVRFYYQDINGSQFNPWKNSQNQPGINVMSHIYFPATGNGYKYDYSAYGMIYRINNQRGMAVSTGALDQMGQVTAEGQTAAWTHYNYPLEWSDNSLSAPKYTRRTDDWVGRTAGVGESAEAPYYTFDVDTANGISKITAPNGIVTESQSDPTSGLVFYTKATKDGAQLGRVDTEWAGLSGPRCPNCIIQTELMRREVKVTDSTGKTRSTYFDYERHTIPYQTYSMLSGQPVFSYEEEYYCPTTAIERGYDGEELSRRETTYETGFEYTKGRRMLYLPTSVKLFAPGATSPSSRVDYAYDQSPPTPRAGIIMNDAVGPYRGNVTTVTAYADAAGGTLPSTNTTTYDVAGNIVTATADCCQLKSFEYDPAYQYAFATSVVRGGSGQLTSRAAFDFGTGLLRSSTDENLQQTAYEYEPASLRPRKVSAPDGSYTEFEYGDGLYDDPDAAHRHSYVHTRQVKKSAQGAVENEVNRWQYLTGRGQVARELLLNDNEGEPDAYVVRDIEYDVLGRAYRVSNQYYNARGSLDPINPAGLWSTTTFDDQGRVKQVQGPDGVVRESVEYGATPSALTDAEGQQFKGDFMTMTDAAGKKRRTVVDAAGNLRRVDEPDGDDDLGPLASPRQATHYKYDVLGDLIKITQGEQQRFFKYDSLGHLTHQRQPEEDAPHSAPDPLTGNNSWSSYNVYDAHGRLTDSYDARGVHTGVTYDGLNRVKVVTYSDNTPTVTYTYDEARTGFYNLSHLTEVKTDTKGGAPATAQTYGYDRMGRVTDHKQSVGGVEYPMSYSYNGLGQLESQTYPSGKVVTNALDTKGQLLGVSDAGRTYVSGMTYGPHGGLMSETLGNGVVESFEYYDSLQLKQSKLEKGGGVLQRLVYQYGRTDMLTGAVDATKDVGQVGRVDGYIGTAKQWEQRMAYDELGRLSTFAEHRGNDGSLTYKGRYTYDRYGNRYQGGGENQNISYVPVADAEIEKARNRFTTAAGVVYDPAGQMTSDGKFRGRTYEYDANGRQKRSATMEGLTVATTVYDGLGQRVRTTEGDVTTVFVYDAFGKLVAEYGPAGGSPLSVKFVATDQKGSARVLMNDQGGVVARHDYLPFGEEVGDGVGLRTYTQGYGASSGGRQGYAGMERDGAARELDHTPWRKYDSAAGRWTTADPYGGSMRTVNPQSLNRYAYVGNDPVNLRDPSGLFEEGNGCVWQIDTATGLWECVGGLDGGTVTVNAFREDRLLTEELYRLGLSIQDLPLLPLEDPGTDNQLIDEFNRDLRKADDAFRDCVRKGATALDSKRRAAADAGTNMTKILNEILNGLLTGGVLFGAAGGPELAPLGGIGGGAVGATTGSLKVGLEAVTAINTAMGEFAVDVTNCAIDWSSAAPASPSPDVIARDQGRAVQTGTSPRQNRSTIPWDKVNGFIDRWYPFK